MDDSPLWTPPAARVADAHLTRFIGRIRARRGLPLEGYASLHRWSLERPDAFWFELAHYAGVIADWADGPVLRHGDRMPGAQWFPGARLNYAENLLAGGRREGASATAVVAVREDGRRDERCRLPERPRAVHAADLNSCDGAVSDSEAPVREASTRDQSISGWRPPP